MNWEGWSFDPRIPIYRQIVLQFLRACARGDIKPSERIPSIRDLSAMLKVNTNTVQRAYLELERDGMFISKRGTGYFLSDDEAMHKKTLNTLRQEAMRRFTIEMRELGIQNDEIIANLEDYMKSEEICQ